MRSTFLRLRVYPLRFFQVSNLRLFEVKTSKNLNFRGEVEVSISEVFGRPIVEVLCFECLESFLKKHFYLVFRFGSARRQRKEINLSMVLLAIVVLFFLCHACRIIQDIYEFSNMDKVINCPGKYR